MNILELTTLAHTQPNLPLGAYVPWVMQGRNLGFHAVCLHIMLAYESGGSKRHLDVLKDADRYPNHSFYTVCYECSERLAHHADVGELKRRYQRTYPQVMGDEHS